VVRHIRHHSLQASHEARDHLSGTIRDGALLAAPDRRTPQGQRDYALLLFLYNTGARADEAAQLTIGNVELAQTPTRDLSSVQIHGKGNKLRRCPLWPHTVSALTTLLNGRAPHEHVFLNRCGRPITLATCEVKETKRTRRWKKDKGLMTFLRAL
jgi:integrase